MDNSPIDKLYFETKSILDFLERNNELSFKSDIDNMFKRYLLLVSGGYFEECITNILLNLVSKNVDNKLIIEFLKNKGIKRQYHTYFDWESINANQFFSLFGEEFKEKMSQEVNNKETLKVSIKDFIQIGHARNLLAHKNATLVNLDKTSEETYAQYKSAEEFISFLQEQLL
ncbi:MAG: HEPN domain-containing protein [Candidatus Omnitrophota bacterium]|nr:HEPN domain-containing protein [Candidatus Omnitrophota bacterium]